jgi:hypothetical protein
MHKKKRGPKASVRFKVVKPVWDEPGSLDEEFFEFDDDEGGEEIRPEMAEVSLAGGWLRIVVLVTSLGAVLGPAFAAMTWAKWSAGTGAVLLGLAMAIGQVTAAQRHRFRVMRWVDISFAVTVGLGFGALYGLMVVAFVGAGLGALAWLVLEWFYRGFDRAARVDFPGSRTLAAACGVVVQAFCLNPQAAASGLRYGALIGLGCGVLLSLALLAIAHLVYSNLPRVGYWKIVPLGPARG